ncbi:neuroserpin-like isoform X2 [Esox lucius]|uniref:Serpin family I member 1 n=1 Tax=Esox lucius TaxID=8010 RepID=A0A3P8ZRA8_ESOLU|nr:neuroserpin-like isoform X2 [Esox lucius]
MKTVKMMHYLSLPMLILSLLSILLLGPGCRAADIPEDPTAEFSVRLYHHMQRGDENIIFSPLSVALALGMVELGARGASLTEIRQALGFSRLPKGAEFPLLHKLIGVLSEDGHHYVILLANSLFLQSGMTIKPDFLQLIRKYFQAKVEMVDFCKSSAVAAQLNGWVENHTKGKIHDLFEVNDFSCQTLLTLVNAVYFRGSWKNQFRLKETRPTTFIKDNGSKVQTPMMYQMGDFNYGEFVDSSSEAGGTYQVLEMPYQGEDMSMLIVLPRQEVSLAALEPIIEAPLLEEWASNIQRQEVEVYLPRFKVEQKVDLTQTLKNLGIKKIFTDYADLSAMTTDGNKPFIRKAVHKAYLDVTEEGAEGAAATGVLGDRMAIPLPPVTRPTFKADHPFFFVIRNRRIGSILFMGRVMTPEVVRP